jgi:hypothetical protein
VKVHTEDRNMEYESTLRDSVSGGKHDDLVASVMHWTVRMRFIAPSFCVFEPMSKVKAGSEPAGRVRPSGTRITVFLAT